MPELTYEKRVKPVDIHNTVVLRMRKQVANDNDTKMPPQTVGPINNLGYEPFKSAHCACYPANMTTQATPALVARWTFHHNQGVHPTTRVQSFLANVHAAGNGG